MTKSELIATLANKQPHLQIKDVELVIKGIIEILTDAVANGEGIEIRGFGSFSTISRKARLGRNPKTGESVSVPNRHAIHFKPGLDLRERVEISKHKYQIIKDL